MDVKPTALKAPHGAKDLEISWSDGTTTSFPHWLLRGLCPCAGCQGHGAKISYQEGTEKGSTASLELRDIEQVGNYALSFTWGDGHDGGIYSFAYLRRLAPHAASTPAEVAKLDFGRVTGV